MSKYHRIYQILKYDVLSISKINALWNNFNTVSQNHEMFCPNKLRSVTVKTVTGCEDCLRNDIYYVGWGVKLYSVSTQTSYDSDQNDSCF